MHTHEDGNFRFLKVERGGLYGSPKTVGEKLDAAIQERYVALRAAREARGRVIEDAAGGKTHAMRTIWRHIEKLKARRVAYDEVQRFAAGVAADFTAAVDALYGKTDGRKPA